MSGFNAISTLEGFARTRGNRARDAMGIIRRLVIIRGLIKRI
jgi:hypothetical protein